MIRSARVIGAGVFLALASPTFACTLPPLIAIPAKSQVGDRKPALSDAARAYFEGTKAFTDCVQAELAAVDADAPPLVRALLVARNNASVAESIEVARLFEDNVDLIPLSRVVPEYPRRALDRAQEGWVKIRFSTTPAGAVTDAVVVDAEPKGLFDEAALKSIAGWRYSPRIENGVAVGRVGKETIIIFNLE
ncbi:MAG TPA: energy transducer TonB [Gammaproteobacteria bacterium]|nr:energy transducer TonB [Gammaproteobacteria bacterium]